MANAKFIAEGSSIPHTPGSDLASGDVVVQSELVGVVVEAIKSGRPGSLKVEGIFQFPKLTTDVVVAGDDMFWDDTADEATLTVGANKKMGKATEPAGNGILLVKIRLSQ